MSISDDENNFAESDNNSQILEGYFHFLCAVHNALATDMTYFLL